MMDSIFLIEPFDTFQEAAKELLISLYYKEKAHNAILEIDVLEKAKQQMRKLISECNFDMQKVNEYIHNKEWQQEKTEEFLNQMKQHWSDLLRAALNHYNSTHGETVTNFDWIVKYVLGTSELKTLQYPILQLILYTMDKSGQQKKIMYDINEDMLRKLINVLENI